MTCLVIDQVGIITRSISDTLIILPQKLNMPVILRMCICAHAGGPVTSVALQHSQPTRTLVHMKTSVVAATTPTITDPEDILLHLTTILLLHPRKVPGMSAWEHYTMHPKRCSTRKECLLPTQSIIIRAHLTLHHTRTTTIIRACMVGSRPHCQPQRRDTRISLHDSKTFICLDMAARIP